MDIQKLAELIAEANDKSQTNETLPPVKQKEFREVVAESCVDDGVEETAYTVAAIIDKKLNDEARIEDLTGILMPYDEMYPLDTGPQFYRDSSPILYWIGQEPDHTLTLHRDKPITERFTMNFDSIYYYFEFNIDRLRDGIIVNMNRQIDMARNQLIGAANMLMWKAMSDAVGTSGSNYGSGTLSVAALLAGVNWVEDESQLGAGAILGRARTLTSINNLNASAGGTGVERGYFSDSLKDEAWKKYLLTVFRGVPIVGIRKNKINISPSKLTHAGFSGIDAIPTNRVLFRPKDDFGYIAEQGPITPMQTQTAKDRTIQYSGGRRMGAIIFDNGDLLYRHDVS